jgi:alcohol dehydrogenase class IV
MHHGLANALNLVSSMKFCAARKPGLYRRVGIACGLDVMKSSETEADQQTIQFISTFLAELGLSGRLRDFGAKPEQLDQLIEQAIADPCHKTNAVPVSPEDFRKLYQEVL